MFYAHYDAVGHFFRWKCSNKEEKKHCNNNNDDNVGDEENTRM